jgi:hypothetical protein
MQLEIKGKKLAIQQREIEYLKKMIALLENADKSQTE